MQSKNNQVTPANKIVLLKFIIWWFIEFWAGKYAGILSEKMLGMYGKIFTYLAKGGNNNTPEFFSLLLDLWPGEGKELMEIGASIPMEILLPGYVKEYFEWYALEHTEKTIIYLEKVKSIIAKLDAMGKGMNEDRISDLLMAVESDIDIAKNRGDLPLGYRTGIEFLDSRCEGIQAWTVTRLNAYSGTGKSKLTYFICNNLLRDWKKVLYFSLEVQAKMVLKNLLANWYKEDFYPLMKGKIEYDFMDFYDQAKGNLDITDKFTNIREIEEYVKLQKPDVVFIDFVQNMSGEWASEYERMTKIAVQIQRMAIENNVAVFDVSQISNEGSNYKLGQMIPSKGSGGLVASADVGLVLYKSDNLLKLAIAKNKFGDSQIETILEYNFSKWTFIDKWPNTF